MITDDIQTRTRLQNIVEECVIGVTIELDPKVRAPFDNLDDSGEVSVVLLCENPVIFPIAEVN